MRPKPVPLPPPSADGLPEGMPSDHGIATLAWDALPWAEEFLAQPDGKNAGEPWQWTATQARIIAWWFSVNHLGTFWYRRGQIVLPKGAGKSPLAAALGCLGLAGPVLFDGFDAYGEAVAKPHPSPYIQLAAVSQDQTDNTMSLVLSMLRDGRAALEVPDLDLGLTRVRTRNGKLEPVTASATSREGQRLTDAILDEPHLWVQSNGGLRLAATIRRNLGKMNGRSIETTNCWVPGEGSVAEMTFEYFQKILEGKAAEAGLMRYHPEAQVDDLDNEEEVRSALKELYHDSPWINIDRIIAEIHDVSTHPADARRFYLNQTTVAEDGWISQHEWKACEALDKVVKPGEAITLGFDGSRKRARGIADSTALIGCRVSDGHLFEVRVWEQPDGPAGKDWEAPTTEVDAVVRDCFKTYNVVGFYADPAKWESWVAQWEAAYGTKLKVGSRNSPIKWWMTGGRSILVERALEQFYVAMREQELSHDGSAILWRHALNARRRVEHGHMKIDKEHPDSARKIDAIVAAVLAYTAYLDAVSKGVNNPSRKYAPEMIR